jgi:hypothetical protein
MQMRHNDGIETIQSEMQQGWCNPEKKLGQSEEEGDALSPCISTLAEADRQFSGQVNTTGKLIPPLSSLFVA